MKNLTLEGKIVIFKTIALSKTVFQSLIITVLKYIVNKFEETQKAFLQKKATSKVTNEILCNDYKAGRLKNDNISNKIIALQFSKIKQLYGNFFHE